MMKHDDFRKGGMVSVWIGNFSSDDALDDYLNLDRKFEEDFGFELNENDMPETSVESTPLAINKLVEGFSWHEAYAQSIVELAKRQGIEQATTMIVFLNFGYRPELTNPKQDAPLTFMGAVPFSSTPQ